MMLILRELTYDGMKKVHRHRAKIDILPILLIVKGLAGFWGLLAVQDVTHKNRGFLGIQGDQKANRNRIKGEVELCFSPRAWG